jgi:ATP-dependent DNA helicase RecQ
VPSKTSRKPSAATVRAAARDSFGWTDLRPGQLEAVRALVGGSDVLVVLPTGAGKSAVYQLGGLLIDGPTVVISPLIALQRDQLAGLAEREGQDLEAVAINSAQKVSSTNEAWESLRAGTAEFVFLAPEQLANDEVVTRLAEAGVSLLAIDEAHCVSTWGHDFRPDYLRIGDVRERLGNPRVVALTATASPPVRAEIMERLRLSEPVQVIQGFDRPNLGLEVRRFVTARDKQVALVETVAGLDGTGLVYAATRKETERIAAELEKTLEGTGRTVACYHAGLKAAEREEVHEAFHAGQVDVVVATSAFGMGIDKPDVRFVVHADPSESVDSYYQEIGRAGRDGEPARIILFYRPEDLGVRQFFASGGADEELLYTVVKAVKQRAAGQGSVAPSVLQEQLELSHTRLTNAVNLLEQAGAVAVDPAGELEYPDGDLKVGEAVERAEELARSRSRVERSRIEMMRGYAETGGCRRQFLLGYFGEAYPQLCGNCDTCASGSAQAYAAEESAATTGDHRFPLEAAVKHREWGNGIVMRHEPDRITVLFDDEGYRTLSLRALEADEELLTLRG